MQRDINTGTITWHLGLVGSNIFGEYTSVSLFTLFNMAIEKDDRMHECFPEYSHMGTTRMNEDKETEVKRVNIWNVKRAVPMA